MKRITLLLLVIMAISVLGIGCSKVESDPIAITERLAFTSPGDDYMVGLAAEHDVRYSTSSDSLINFWDLCAQATNIQVPKPPYTNDTMYVDVVVETGVMYYFAIKTADEIPNWSGISNFKTVTYADVTPPSDVTDLR